jgi:hypothetical protein
MALLPYALRPGVIIRRKALRQGLLGPSLFWKVVAGWVFGKSTLKKIFGKQPESLGSWNVGSNRAVNVISAKPLSKRKLRRTGITRSLIVARAIADARSAHPDKKIVVRSK